MTDTANLGLPFIEGNQAQKHVTHNEALLILDAAIQIAVLDFSRTRLRLRPMANVTSPAPARPALGAVRLTPSPHGRTARGHFSRRTRAGESGRSPTM